MKIFVVGLGPGGGAGMTFQAAAALEQCDVIAGYEVYIDLVREQYAHKTFLSTPMCREEERCRLALAQATAGKQVAMVCSGDAGVYGMAGLIYELAQEYPPVEIEVVPGVTAACSGAALLGAPLIHDFAVISLSDLLTPWEKIEKRLDAAGAGDFSLCLYNPASKKRADYLQKACDILLCHRAPETVAGIVRNIGRAEESARVLTLAELRDTPVDMFTTVFVGNSQTKNVQGKMVTPRGYRGVEAAQPRPQQASEKQETAGQTPLCFPLFCDWSGKKAIVFGGGTVASRRATTLSPFCGAVTVVAPSISPELQAGAFLLRERPYQPGDCAGYDIVIAATNDRAVNAAIALEAKAAGILVNVADAPDDCDFYFPAVVRQGSLVVGVTASGQDHRLAKQAAAAIRARLGEAWREGEDQNG